MHIILIVRFIFWLCLALKEAAHFNIAISSGFDYVLCYFWCHITYKNIACLFTYKILIDLLAVHAEITSEMHIFIRNVLSLVTCLNSLSHNAQFMTQGRSSSIINCALSLNDKMIQITRPTYIWCWWWTVNIFTKLFTKLSSKRLHFLLLVWKMIPRSGDIQHKIMHSHCKFLLFVTHASRAASRFAPSQWETALLCNDVSHWLGASLESALCLSPIYARNNFIYLKKWNWN